MAVYGGLRSARWLRTFRQAPMVTAFRNLESGQVLFSQTVHPQEFYINQQFKWPNWQNKKPTTRKDMWRPLAVAEVPTWDCAVRLYRNLVELRHRRDMYERNQARDWRRKSPDGNVWFWNQYRPTYTYEAVADLVSALEAMDIGKSIKFDTSSVAEGQSTSEANAATDSASKKAIIHWGTPYHKGSDSHWTDINAEHRELPAHNPREQFVVLNGIRQEALARADELHSQLARETERITAEAHARGELGPIEQRREQRRVDAEHKKRVYEARLRAKERLHAQRPDLAELASRGEAVQRATRAWREAVKTFDPFTPRGQRGAAKQPIKLRQRALRQAKRAFRELKKRIAGRNNKRRVPQPRVRMQL